PTHHLHSFPTRRSSDLFSCLRGRSRRTSTSSHSCTAGHSDSSPGAGTVFTRPTTTYSGPHGARRLQALVGSKRSSLGRRRPIQADRKSTRLNSSHVSIS